MSDVLSNPLVPWILALLVVVVVYRQLAPRLAHKLSWDRVLGTVLGASYAKAKLERAVAQAKKQGNFLAAGQLYEDEGDLAKAVEVYLKGEEKWAAADAHGSSDTVNSTPSSSAEPTEAEERS